MNFKYCNSLTHYKRFLTREVNIGGIAMGGNNPIRIQSMTNTPTLDTKATVEQCIRIINAGADYVRITAPGIQDAENLALIKKELRARGYQTPLIADIHFNPKAAEIAAAIVEKVRINPGNYADSKRYSQSEITEKEYHLGLEKIHEKLLPLLKICKTHGTAIRIGVNHGSLSERIMSRYGDTPQGMVEAAFEFLRICKNEGFHQLVVSLKASNTRIMVQAYRLLAANMLAENMAYPLHIGVTEAGDAEDGRIKSAVGIGALLADGLGDTVRVSLTEEPEAEISVARELIQYFLGRSENSPIPQCNEQLKNPFTYEKRETIKINQIGGNQIPVIIAEKHQRNFAKPFIPDFIYLTLDADLSEIDTNAMYILNMKEWFMKAKHLPNVFPLYTDAEFAFYGVKNEKLNFVFVSNVDLTEDFLEILKIAKNTVIILETFHTNGIADQRSFFYQLKKHQIDLPVIINRNYSEDKELNLQLKSASDLGLLLVDGFGDGIWLRNAGTISQEKIIACAFGILQASRVRTSKTEYISCPSCGRTIFDLQTTTASIKAKTSHLSHLKIGIMGCIVNGPGEMADADYGFVGAAAGKITLYKGKVVIKKNIPSELAVDELIALIKENGDWREPEI